MNRQSENRPDTMDRETPQTEEPDLIARLQQGDPAAFEEAVKRYTPNMLAVARYYLDNATAEDVVQDSWVAVVDAIKRFEGRSGLKTWLHRIVANRAKNHLRRAQREVQTDFNEPLEPALAARFKPDGHWAQPPALTTDESAQALLENGALSDCLDKHLSQLPENQRSALLLFEAHQHSSQDVCDILEVSAANLRVLVHRARQRIFLMVERFQQSGEC